MRGQVRIRKLGAWSVECACGASAHHTYWHMALIYARRHVEWHRAVTERSPAQEVPC